MKKSTKEKSFLLRVLDGMLIGANCIIPGASGGVLAVAMGLYEPCVEAVYAFFRYFKTKGKESFVFLLPLGIGGVVGLLACSFGLEWLLKNVREPFMFVLLGMVLGGLPSFFKEANSKGFRPRYLIASLIAFVVVGAAALANDKLNGGAGIGFSSWTAMLGGAIIVAGTMIPGMSTSFLLMMLGIYEPILAALTHFHLLTLVFVGIGGVFGGGLMLIIVRYMFRRFHGYSYYAMLGLLLVTLIMIFPGISLSMLIWDLLLIAGGFALTYFMTKSQKKAPLTDPASASIIKEDHQEELL